jgi:3-deoxy-D-manno-octulosonic-acid transferase
VRYIYSAVLFLYSLGIRVAAIGGNHKARLWFDGRKKWRDDLRNKLQGKSKSRIWVHCASLGEFEQGRPLIEAIRKDHADLCIVLTFFSPSGYEIRKHYAQADVVMYLPLDSKKNSHDFISIVSPQQVFFIKYEYWINYFEELKRRKIPLYLVSAIFRQGQVFFKSYGGIFRRVLKNVSHIYVQDKDSVSLLNSIGINHVTDAGDTRFDRVNEIVASRKPVESLAKFKGRRTMIIAGSSWKDDEEILLDCLKQTGMQNVCLVIAPHEVNEVRVNEIERSITDRFPSAKIDRYSGDEAKESSQFFILDTIGLLSSAYYYSDIVWIGGGFGKGIHNTLEAAAFGKPVLFGPNYKKFKEACDLVSHTAAFPVERQNAFSILERLITDKDFCNKAGRAGSAYVSSNTGATARILESVSASSIA